MDMNIFTRMIALPAVAAALSACSVEKVEAPAAAPEFVYDEASAEEQEAWLSKEAWAFRDGIAAGLRRSLSSLSTHDPVYSTKHKTIRVTSQSKWSNLKIKVSGAQRQELQAQTCRDYLRTTLRKQGIRTVVYVKDHKSVTVFSVEGDERRCARYENATS